MIERKALAILMACLMLMPTLAMCVSAEEPIIIREEFLGTTKYDDKVYRVYYDDGTDELKVVTPWLVKIRRSISKLWAMSIYGVYGHGFPVTAHYYVYMHKYWDDGSFRYYTFSIYDVVNSTYLLQNQQHAWSIGTSFEQMARTAVEGYGKSYGADVENTRIVSETNVPYIEVGVKSTTLNTQASTTTAKVGDRIKLYGTLRNDRGEFVYTCEPDGTPNWGVFLIKDGVNVPNSNVWSYDADYYTYPYHGTNWEISYVIQPEDAGKTLNLQAGFEGKYSSIFENFRDYVVYEQTKSNAILVTVASATETLSISSTPSGASVYLDGVYKGTTPLTILDVSVGSHTIKLTLSGYADHIEIVTVVTGDNPISVSLIKEPDSKFPIWQTIIDWLLSWIWSIFNKFTIVGPATIDTATPVSYSIELTALAPADSDWSDGTYSELYGGWVVVAEDGTIITQSDWAKLTNAIYSANASFTTPATEGEYSVVAVIVEIKQQWNGTTNVWETLPQEVVVKESWKFTVAEPITQPPAVQPNPIAELVQWLLDWFRGLLGWV